MKQQKIKESYEFITDQIQKYQFQLLNLQEQCEHPETFEGTWSYRVGSFFPAEICSDCRKLIKYL